MNDKNICSRNENRQFSPKINLNGNYFIDYYYYTSQVLQQRVHLGHSTQDTTHVGAAERKRMQFAVQRQWIIAHQRFCVLKGRHLKRSNIERWAGTSTTTTSSSTTSLRSRQNFISAFFPSTLVHCAQVHFHPNRRRTRAHYPNCIVSVFLSNHVNDLHHTPTIYLYARHSTPGLNEK